MFEGKTVGPSQATFHSSTDAHCTRAPRLNKHRRMGDVTVNGGSLACHVEGVSKTVDSAVSAE
eukprot:scaffold795_cov99-Phaeocystis_antarctica.AAC.1